jgi:chemotaxis family two-component system sensor kinase Cph1
MGTPTRIDLLNCADEPIHVPGSIQPHGALVFFNTAGELEGWSANAGAVLGLTLEPGRRFDALGLPEAASELLQECADSMDDDEAAPLVTAIVVNGADYDCVAHAHQGRIVAEFEAREVSTDTVAQFAIKAHSSIERLRRQKTVDALLETAVRQVREVTGFDRVMAYRFRPDDSGDVVAEARRDFPRPALPRWRHPAAGAPPVRAEHPAHDRRRRLPGRAAARRGRQRAA